MVDGLMYGEIEKRREAKSYLKKDIQSGNILYSRGNDMS